MRVFISRRRFLRATAGAFGAAATLGLPSVVIPRAGQAGVPVLIAPFLLELGKWVGAAVVGQVIGWAAGEIAAKSALPRVRINDAKATKLGLSAETISQIQQVASGAAASLAEGGFPFFEKTPSIQFVPHAKRAMLSASTPKADNICAVFAEVGPGGNTPVMIEGPTVIGMHAFATKVAHQKPATETLQAESLIPLADVEKDIGSFDESYLAVHRTQNGELFTRYRCEYPGKGVVQTEGWVGRGAARERIVTEEIPISRPASNT